CIGPERRLGRLGERPERERLDTVQVIVREVLRSRLLQSHAQRFTPEGAALDDVAHDGPEPRHECHLHGFVSSPPASTVEARIRSSPASSDRRIGAPPVSGISVVMMAPNSPLGCRSQVTWMRLPTSRGATSTLTKLPGWQNPLSSTVQVTLSGRAQSDRSRAP